MKRLTTIVELMGGKLEYEYWNKAHIYTIRFTKYTFIASAMNDALAQGSIYQNLEEVFPMYYKNAVNQLK